MNKLSLAIDAWTSLLGADCVLQGEEVLRAYGAETGGQQRQVPVALRLADAALLPALMQIAHLHGVAVYPISTGRNWGYGSALPARDNCVIIDLSGLQKICHFDAELGVVTVEPGVTQGMLASFLDSGQHPFLVPVTGAGPTCSLVGNALERGYGVTPYTDHFGAVTDVEAVLADGSIYRTAMREAGGEDLARLYKWGFGPYSAGLFAQSGFGIVTRMSIVLARRPETVRVCLFSLKDDALLEPAIERVRAILSKLPGTVGGINLMNQRRVLAMSAPYPASQLDAQNLIPQEVIDTMGRQFQVFPWTGFGSLYGTRGMVRAAQKEIKRELAGIASRLIFLSPKHSALLARIGTLVPGKLGERIGSTAAMIGKSLELVNGKPNETTLPLAYWRSGNKPEQGLRNPARDGCGLIWYAPLVPMRPQGARAYVNLVTRIARKHGIEPLLTFTSISDKVFDSTVPLLFDRNDPVQVAAAQACYTELLHEGRALGMFPYRIGIAAMEDVTGMQSSSRDFHRRLRQGIDPDNLISPGRYQ